MSHYITPRWCGLSYEEHYDGVGGCWGVSHGFVEKDGFCHCWKCEYVNKAEKRELVELFGWKCILKTLRDYKKSFPRKRGVK